MIFRFSFPGLAVQQTKKTLSDIRLLLFIVVSVSFMIYGGLAGCR